MRLDLPRAAFVPGRLQGVADHLKAHGSWKLKIQSLQNPAPDFLVFKTLYTWGHSCFTSWAVASFSHVDLNFADFAQHPVHLGIQALRCADVLFAVHEVALHFNLEAAQLVPRVVNLDRHGAQVAFVFFPNLLDFFILGGQLLFQRRLYLIQVPAPRAIRALMTAMLILKIAFQINCESTVSPQSRKDGIFINHLFSLQQPR